MPRINHKAALGSQVQAALKGYSRPRETRRSLSLTPQRQMDLFASGSESYGTFVMTVLAYLWSVGKQGIDTPEERQKIKAAALAAFDKYLAPLLGTIAAKILRQSLDAIVTNALETLGA